MSHSVSLYGTALLQGSYMSHSVSVYGTISVALYNVFDGVERVGFKKEAMLSCVSNFPLCV